MGGADALPRCKNRRLDLGETDTDCGGICERCLIGDRCVIARDCVTPPDGDPSVVECAEGICRLKCLGNRADCNVRADDGCEVDLLMSLDHCGECNESCAPENAVGQCNNGQCRIKTDEPNQGCAPNHADCNLDVEDGCEVNLQIDPDHCGACQDAACSGANGEPSCSAGACDIVCSEGFDDCDENVRGNGCETNVLSSIQHCGACGTKCDSNGPGWAAFCKMGQCGQTECEIGQGDCDGDGTCSDSLSSPENCGGCGLTCNVENGVPACDDDTCSIDHCTVTEEMAWADCDASYVTGCETDTFSNPTHCGGCLPDEGGTGTNCSLKEGSDHVTVAGCGAGKCVVAGCETGWADCDGSFENGCEANTNVDENNCGACASDGGEACVEKAHTPSECVSGSCDYSCDPGWADLNNDRYKSTSNGCETRAVTVKNAGTWGSQDTGGSGPSLKIQHTLQSSAGTGRLVLVGIVCRDYSGCSLTRATYGGAQLSLLEKIALSNSTAAIYYALDAALPAPGTYTVELDKGDAWGSISAEVLEFRDVSQSAPFAVIGKTSSPDRCDTTGALSVQLDALPAGSIVYAVGGGDRDAEAAVSTQSPLSLSQSEDSDFTTFGSAYSDRLTGRAVAVFDFSGCIQAVMMAVGVRPPQ